MRLRGDLIRASRRGRSAFTLIELLVAAALTLVIAGLIVGLISNGLVSWNRTQGALTSEGQARLVFDQLTMDLQGACFRDDGNAWLALTVQAASSASGAWVEGAKPTAESLNPNAAHLADARFGVAGVWLRFLTHAQGTDPRTNDPAGPVAVSYQIVRRPPTPSSPACQYLLYRSAVTPSATFAAGSDLVSENYLTGSDVIGSAGNIVRPGFLQAMADNIIDFGVRFYRTETDAATRAPVLRQIFPRDSADLDYRAQWAATRDDPGSRFPTVVDVMLRVLTDEGARKIAALEAGNIRGDWWTVALTNSRVFTRRIIFPAEPG